MSYLTGGGLRYAGYDKVWCIPKNALERYGELEPIAISRTQDTGSEGGSSKKANRSIRQSAYRIVLCSVPFYARQIKAQA